MKIGSEEAQVGELPNTATGKRIAMSLCRCFLACFMGCGIQPIQSVQELDWFRVIGLMVYRESGNVYLVEKTLSKLIK